MKIEPCRFRKLPRLNGHSSVFAFRPSLSWLVSLCFLSGLFTPFHAPADETISLRIERAPSVTGPWQGIDLLDLPLDAAGGLRLPAGLPAEFFRARIELGSAVEDGSLILLSDVPESFRQRAGDALEARRLGKAQAMSGDPEGWSEHAVLAPWVRLPRTVMGDGSVRPAYYEFKVLNELPPDEESAFGGSSPDRATFDRDAGYLLLSMTEDDFPLAEFATIGLTPSERLMRVARSSRVRVVRYGAGFWAAEDAEGRLVVSEGSLPYKFPPEFFGLDAEWRGDDEAQLDEDPPDLPRVKPEFYESYETFKQDYAAGDSARLVREGIAGRARLEWQMLRGEGPPLVSLEIGEDVLLVPHLPSSPPPYVYFLTDDDSPLRISTPQNGGVYLFGASPGFGLLEIRQGDEEHVFRVNVRAREVGGIRPQGHVTGHVVKYWQAGTDAMQPAYTQPLRSEWCKAVGCGPLAWAMLFAWFDRNWNVGMAFQGPSYLLDAQAPPDLNSTANLSKALFTLRELHDLCDVICSPVSNDGATYPTDMTSGFKGYTWLPRLAQYINRSWVTRATPPPTKLSKGAAPSRAAIWNGYPGVTGYSWHYGLAYGYQYEAYILGNVKVSEARWLKCNQGWGGGGSSTKWINFGNVFYSANVRITRGTLHP
jgi:hypothetical protein